MITHTEERIHKLIRKGLSVRSIARKIGRPGREGEQRVWEAMKRMNLPVPKAEDEDE